MIVSAGFMIGAAPASLDIPKSVALALLSATMSTLHVAGEVSVDNVIRVKIGNC